MSTIDICIEKARKLQKRLVLPEGQDPRVIKAAQMILEAGIVSELVVLASPEEFKKAAAEAGVEKLDCKVIDYMNDPLFEDFSNELFKMREAKGLTLEKARAMMSSRIYFGAMMSRRGMVDGLVAGSIASTPDMLRAAFHCIGTAPGMKSASSCFVMDLAKPAPAGDSTLLFADCGVNPNPDAAQLCDIALATANTYRALQGKTPKVAFLSFSTYGSAKNEILDKVIEATRLFKERIAAENLDILADGELQLDAAIVPSVAKSKAPDSPVAGEANVLIFPDLNAGNIGYKLTQRLAGAEAYGPILQGLAKPLNDLSRGCSAEDIFGVAAITCCQAGE